MSGAIRTGDKVVWLSPIWAGSGRKYKKVGEVQLSGTVVRHSYGPKTGQHTFSILLIDGTNKLVKGRHLYPNLISHNVDYHSPDRR